MGIGVGIFFIAVGLVLTAGVINIDTAYVDETSLGWILIIVGAIGIVIALVINAQRQRHTYVSKSDELP